MAGEWLPMRLDLSEDPAVIGMADALGIDEDYVVGKLHKLWSWANKHLEDGHASVTENWIDRHVKCEKFASQMASVGWIVIEVNGSVTFPKFDRWNSRGAKNRLNTAERQRKSRHANVTKVSRSKRDKSVTREEKRIEEKRIEEKREELKTTPTESADAASPPLPKAEKPPRKEATGPHAEAIRAFTSRWNSQYRETYPFAAKDGTAVAAILKRCGGSVEKFTAAVERYLADPDPFYRGHGLKMLESKLERWITPGAANGSSSRPGEPVRRPGRLSADPGKYDHLNSAPGTVAGEVPNGTDLFGSATDSPVDGLNHAGTAEGVPKTGDG